MIKRLIKNMSNIPGWRTNRKIVVIESDDWGSIRMPSNQARLSMMSKGVLMGNEERQRYTNYDTLALKSDFEVSYNTLQSFRDINGNNPKITAVSVVANPDFDKIKASNFNEYFYEPFTTTFKTLWTRRCFFEMWQEGIKQRFVCATISW